MADHFDSKRTSTPLGELLFKEGTKKGGTVINTGEFDLFECERNAQANRSREPAEKKR